MNPETPSDRVKLERADDPRLRRAWASRARRRRYTVLYVALVIGGAAVLGWVPRVGGTLQVIVPMLAMGAAIGVALFVITQLTRFTRLSLPHRLLDERQRADRDAAHRVAHKAMAAVLMAVFFLAYLVPVYSPPSVVFPSELATPLLFTLVMLHTSAPACYLAWTQPDELPDDDGPDRL
ncbi:hypothetical protein ACWFMI_00430 [Nocardiopsis terrae]